MIFAPGACTIPQSFPRAQAPITPELGRRKECRSVSASSPGPAAIDVSEMIDAASVGALHVGIFALCALCMVMDGFDVYALGYIAPAIVQEWKISPALLGPVFGAVNVGVLVGQVSFTMLADRIGRRPVLIGGVLFFGVMTFFTA